MSRPGRELPVPRRRDRRRAGQVSVGAMAAACLLYLASPFAALWSTGVALQRHDDAALSASLDWKLVRSGLKEALGLRPPVQRVSQQDELPGFGESFVVGVASSMIDEDITPERLDAMLSAPAMQGHGAAGLPRGFFVSPARFQAEIRMNGEAPIEISMRIEKWRWKITRIRLPADMLTPPATTHLASARS